MIKCQELNKLLLKNKFNFITGVPCSIFKDFLNFLEKDKKFQHVIAASEGEACGIAAGYYLAENKVPIVYMQNSGLGNAVNPLTSLLDQEVFSIPALLFISWRGEPDIPDEPQHVKMGKIVLPLLQTLGVPYQVLSGTLPNLQKSIKQAKEHFRKNKTPFALIFKKGLIEPLAKNKASKTKAGLAREEAIKEIINNLRGNEFIVATTGKISRELFEIREINKQNHKNDFYVVGSMGCAAGIGLGVALKHPRKKIFVFDGDGAVLMKMGTLATIGHYKPKNLFHLVLDNNAYDSTGGQKTVSNSVDLAKIALACGYNYARIITQQKQISYYLKNSLSKKGPVMLILKVTKGAREDLGRPSLTPLQNKKHFIKTLQGGRNKFFT